MKITKRGTPKSNRLWKGTCYQCESQAEAEENELTHITDDPRERTQFSWEKCPVCGHGAENNGYGGMLFYPAKSAKVHYQ